MTYAPFVSCDGFAGRHNCATQQGRGEKVVHRKVQASPSFVCSRPSGWPAFRRRAKREDKIPDSAVRTSLGTDNEVLVANPAPDMVRTARPVAGREGLVDTGTVHASRSRQVTHAKRNVETVGQPGKRRTEQVASDNL